MNEIAKKNFSVDNYNKGGSFNSLENLEVSEGCFSDIMKLLKPF